MRTEAGYRPMTAPISARMMSERRCSPAAGVATVARKRTGSAIRHVTRLSTSRFFLSIVRYSDGAGRKNRMRLSSRTTRSNGATTWRPGSARTRTTRPKRVTIPNSVTSRTKNEETSAQIADAAVTAGRIRRSTKFDRSFAVVDCCTILACLPLSDPIQQLPGLGRPRRLHQPQVEILDVAGAGPHKFAHARQHVFECFKLQSEFCQ